MTDAETWLKKRGVPHFVLATMNPKDPQAREYRLVHAAVAMLLAAGFGALVADGPGMAWVAEAAIPLAVTTAALGWELRSRHVEGEEGRFRHPRPGQMTIATLVAIALATGADVLREERLLPWTAGLAALFALAMLAVAAATPEGLARIARWAITHPLREARHNAKVIVGALPLLLLTVAFLFLTTEVWEVAAHLTEPELAAMVAVFAGVGLLFLLVLARGRVADAQCFVAWEQVRYAMYEERPDPPALEATLAGALADSPEWKSWGDVQKWLVKRREALEPGEPCEAKQRWWRKGQAERARLLRELRIGLDETQLCPVEDVPELDAREHWNIAFVLLFGQVVQVLFVTVLMAVFLLGFGWLAVDHGTLAAWGVQSEHLWRELTEEHVKVTVLLAAFSGLSYAVSAALLPEQRDYFFGELDRKTTQRLAVRALYRGLKR